LSTVLGLEDPVMQLVEPPFDEQAKQLLIINQKYGMDSATRERLGIYD
jgi:hypothetical protein